MHLDFADLLNLVSTVTLIGALVFTGLQVRAANRTRREQAAVTAIQTAALSANSARILELLGQLPEGASAAEIDKLDAEVKRQLVVRPVNLKHAVGVDLRFTLRGQLPAHPVGSEDRIRIARAFEDLLVHAAVARVSTRSATGHIDHHLSGCLAGGRIERHAPTLELEAAVHGMQDVVKSECDDGPRWVELHGRFRGGHGHSAD